MKRYLRLVCTTCKRSIDKLVDLAHYTPDQCTITLGCEGRLQPVEYRSSAGIAVAPEMGVTDWRKRGTTPIDVKTTSSPLIDLFTGELKQLVIGVPSSSPSATHVVSFEVKNDSPKEYRQYVFRKEGAFTSVSGIESGLEKKALRFSTNAANPDVVEVFVNGVKRERGTGPSDYQLYDGSTDSTVPPNTILFNTPISGAGVTQLDVIVSKEQASTTVNLEFKRNTQNESRLNLGAFENISFVERFENGSWVKYWLFTLDIDSATNLPLNSILTTNNSNSGFFLLARPPYSSLDRYANLIIPLSRLDSDLAYINFFLRNGEISAQVSSEAIELVFPPLRFGKFVAEPTLKKRLQGVSEQIVIDGDVIIGPDA